MSGLPRRLWAVLCGLTPALALGQTPSLSLEEAIRSAVERHERPAIAAEQAVAADARVAEARAFFFPEVTVSGSYVRRLYQTVRNVGGQNVTIQARNAFSATGAARWTLFDARAFPLYRAARREQDAAHLEARQAQRLVSFEAADAFLQTLAAEQVADAARRRHGLAGRALEDARARFAAKLVSVNDVTRAELEAATAERETTLARGQLEAALAALGFLLGEDTQRPLARPAGLLARAAEPLPPPTRTAPVERLDLAAARERARAADALIGEARNRVWPTLSALGQYRLSNETGLLGRVGDGFVGLDLTWSLFDGGERYALVDQRAALARAAALSARLLEREVGLELQTARVAVEAAQAALKQSELAAEVAQRNADETRLLYRQGLTGALEVADAAVRLFEAEVALARERYGLAMAWLDLRAARGLDPLPEEVTP